MPITFDCLIANENFMLCNFVPFKRLPPLKNDNTAQKRKFSIKDFCSKCDQIRRKFQIQALVNLLTYYNFSKTNHDAETKSKQWDNQKNGPAGNYLLKFNNKNTRTRCEICSKLTIKTPERRHWRCNRSPDTNTAIIKGPGAIFQSSQ